eukprot:m.182150 g.182150  ORF g.182150 m.182150 type:complete len:370 (+) comp18056_c5_seq1:931-2040(+)
MCGALSPSMDVALWETARVAVASLQAERAAEGLPPRDYPWLNHPDFFWAVERVHEAGSCRVTSGLSYNVTIDICMARRTPPAVRDPVFNPIGDPLPTDKPLPPKYTPAGHMCTELPAQLLPFFNGAQLVKPGRHPTKLHVFSVPFEFDYKPWKSVTPCTLTSAILAPPETTTTASAVTTDAVPTATTAQPTTTTHATTTTTGTGAAATTSPTTGTRTPPSTITTEGTPSATTTVLPGTRQGETTTAAPMVSTSATFSDVVVATSTIPSPLSSSSSSSGGLGTVGVALLAVGLAALVMLLAMFGVAWVRRRTVPLRHRQQRHGLELGAGGPPELAVPASQQKLMPLHGVEMGTRSLHLVLDLGTTGDTQA